MRTITPNFRPSPISKPQTFNPTYVFTRFLPKEHKLQKSLIISLLFSLLNLQVGHSGKEKYVGKIAPQSVSVEELGMMLTAALATRPG